MQSPQLARIHKLLLYDQPPFSSSTTNQCIRTLFYLPVFVRSAILLIVEGDAVLDVYKDISWTRATTDPESFLLVNVVVDVAASQGTQQRVNTNGTTSGITQVVAHFPGFADSPFHTLILILTRASTAEPTMFSRSLTPRALLREFP